jgi:hypothetical protein
LLSRVTPVSNSFKCGLEVIASLVGDRTMLQT